MNVEDASRGSDSSRVRLPTEAEVLQYFELLSNKGRWGTTDELGTLNYITRDKLLHSVGLVRDGISIGCATSIGHEPPAPDVPFPPLHFMVRSGEGRAPIRGGAVDFVGLVFHSHIITHIDALAHTIWNGEIYNGRSGHAVTTEEGATSCSVEALRNGVVTRGVLLDIAGLKDVSYLEPGEPILPEDLEAAERLQGVRVTEGDALLVRTGWWERRVAKGPHAVPLVRPGLHAATLPWIHDRRVALVGIDAAHDVMPSGYPRIEQPVHQVGQVSMGLWLLDVCDFTSLRTACERRGRWEFLFVVAPLRIRYGTGSPVTPLAVL